MAACGAAWVVLAAVACARAGPGPPGRELRFEHALYNVSIPENSPPRTYAAGAPGAPPLGVPLPAEGARVRFRIRHGDKDKFFKAEERTVGDFCFLSIRTRAGHADVLNRERRDAYRLEVRAAAALPDGATLEADALLAVTVTDENDLSPLFYPTEYEALVPEDAPLHSSVVRVAAEDADLGLNGEIYYSLPEADGRFAVHPTTGVVTLTRPLSAAAGARHRLTVEARDRASLLARGAAPPASARASVTVRVARVNLHAPEMRVRRLPELVENSTAEVYAIVEVHDRDAGEHGRIAALDIVDGDPDGHFRVRPSAQRGEYDVVVHALLDREAAPRGYNLTLRALDAGTPPRASYLTLPVTLVDANDNAPVFSREVYEASVSETAPPNTPVIRLKVSDRDEGRNARVYIEIVGGNEGGEFVVNPDTGVLYTAVALDAEEKALYTLTVSAIDQGNVGTRKQSSAKVKVAVLDANDNDPRFEREQLEVRVPENGPSGAVVARVVARDADSGDNAYISYSIANLQPVPFDVDHFSGAVRTTRLLDYESMRRHYTLRIRASDWGLPYRRQAEMRLEIRLDDVNDNRPQFERIDCVGYLPRRVSIGTEIVTLSAIDFDAGDIVSYRIIGGNEDNCFSLDSGTGVVAVSCDLGDVRAESRVLNVTATDGTHFADSTSLLLHLAATGAGAPPAPLECRETGVARRLADLLAAAERSNAPPDAGEDFPPAPSRYGDNLHSPEFLDFPVEVKVNESVGLGTSLVKLRARDRDLGYNGLLTFGISGGDPDSAFRIDPETGELQVIGYLDRERETEYYLNVTVYDLGSPRRAASRLLPVTVLDVNDNPPRFDKTLASFRVTENALNGTAIFRVNATDRDAGDNARIAYSLVGVDGGEFCVDRETGALAVCAPLDRERRALYELTVRATDGGGLHAEALVRVAVDDVNDNPPRFPLASYSARVREDVPVGTLVAVLEAFDPDLGEGGRVLYSLPEQVGAVGDEVAFVVDPESGALRTARPLDFEERQVYGVTVRATDGGRPPLSAEAALIVELEDVDENVHAPRFADPVVLQGGVREDAPRGTRVLDASATDADPPGRDSRLAYYIVAGSGMAHFAIDDTGVIRTVSPLDRETTPHYWLTLCAQDHGLVPKHTCVQVYIEVEDVNDMVPWPERAAYDAAVPEAAPAGTRVAVVRAVDGDAGPGAPAQVFYSIVAGNPDGLFSIDERSGEIVTTGRALDREAAASHALEVRCSDGELASTVRVHVRVLDLNDHAPAFSQRFYDIRVPTPPAPPAADTDTDHQLMEDGGDGEEASTEWEEGDEPEEGSAAGAARAHAHWHQDAEDDPQGIYLGSVVAVDPDDGDNGTVRYWVRGGGAVRGAVRVGARSGRLVLAGGRRALPASVEVAVRACDAGAPRPRCSVARVALRPVPPGGGGAPALSPPPPLQVAELDAPGFLLAVLQATDPDGDPLYYEIVDGDPRLEFHVGREDGSLTLRKRLVWERQPAYTLNVSVSDGRHAVHAAVPVAVVNDADEGGVAFSQPEYAVEASEAARAGDPLAATPARAAGGARLLYGVHAARAPASLDLFRLHELTGVLELAQPLDRESAGVHELTVWARDQAPRASRAFARVLVRVHDADEHPPTWGRRLAEARLSRSAPAGALVAALRAADPDAGDAAALVYSLAGGDAGGLFAVDAQLGDVRLTRALPPAGAGPRDYTLTVRAANPPPAPGAHSASLLLHVLVVEPEDAPPRFAAAELTCEVAENEPAGTSVAAVDARGGTSLRYSLEGGEGMFRINPAAGLLATAAPLDYETRNTYNLTVTALNMGGGSSSTRVVVHVVDRNEYPPRLTSRVYRGRVSEAAAAGALVSDAAAAGDAPLVLLTEDGDSPDNRQLAYEILDPSAAALFRVDPTTGALRTAARLDYERASSHAFTVRVVDMGTPRLPGGDSGSRATVTVEVTDVNDCPPTFDRSTYEATVLLPTVRGVRVATVAATDPDPPPGGAVHYDVIEGDEAGAFAVSPRGELSVARPEALPAAPRVLRLRVRASDGRYSSTARVEVRVRDADNSGLAFQKADYYGSVVENSTKPTTVAVLNVLGAALNEHIEFALLNPEDGFEVGRTSGAVRSGGLALDREARDRYTLLVEARSPAAAPGAEPRVARARLHVTVTDVNDNCPVFVERPYAAAVLAGAAPGTPVLRVRAVDLDANDNGEVRYEMKRGHGELFRVDRRTGQVALRQTVEAREAAYRLVIAAFDGGVPACGADAEVTVRVWPGGAAPAWPRAHYALEAREDAAPGAPLPDPLQALSPLNRQLIYTLVDDAAGALEIHFDTAPDGGNNPCALVPRVPLDYEAAAARELSAVVRAADGVTGAFADVAVTLRVLDVNDCEPEFELAEYRAAVAESAPPGHLVAAVTARDADSGANGALLYSLAALERGTPADHFAVDPASGEVRVAAPLDAEARARYHLVVTATDGGRPPLSSSAHLFIAVEDVNDNEPRMERALLAVAVSGEAARGTALGRAAAWDADARDATRLRYALLAAPPAFRLAPLTGVLSLAGAPPSAPPRSLNVSVSDGAHAAFARIKLTLAPANRHAPRFPHLVHEARALENQPPPLLLTTVKAYDEDGGEYGAVTYSIPSSLLRETFAIDAGSGALTARVPLDREARAEWEVPVTAADGGGRLRHTVVRVRVADLNDNAPSFPLREYRACVRADRAPAGAPFLTLAATDPDAGDNARLVYSVYEGEVRSDAAGLFRVDPTTGALSFARDATAFASRSLRVWVRARDGGGLAAEAPVVVFVLGAGEEAPALRAPPPSLFLREDAAPGAVLADLAAPGSAPARLRLAPGRSPPGQFTLDAQGRLLLAAPLDRELAPDHVIGVIAEGGGSPAPATMVVTRLHVLDVNEHAPAFHSQPYVVHLAENTPPHSSVVQLMAEDPDAGSNGEVRYSLARDDGEEGASPGPDPAALFAIDPSTGWVTTLAALDREAQPEHRVALLAADGGSPRRVARGTLVVRLVDYNDCPPAFERAEYAAEVREDAPPGTVVARLALLDPDALAAPLSFFIEDGDPRARFQLRASGELYVARALDRELEPAHELAVAATDGKFTARARVRVAVLDVDDNPPYCPRARYRVRLPEDAAVGTRVMTLDTADADEPRNAELRYYLSGELAHRFAVDRETGAVRTAAPLDRETAPRYRLRVHAAARARHDWECSAELQLDLDDVNDNAPLFSTALYSVTLPEDAELGTLVAKVHAIDPDLGENRSVSYSWLEGGEAFSLSAETGIVTLSAALDRETQAEHRAVVRAVDAGRPPRSATATLRLTVADVNDNPPEFEYRTYRALVPELDAPGAEVLRVRATSRDAGLNALVTYSLVGGDDRDDFTVDRATGVLRVARPLDYERRREYLLAVQAVDAGEPPLSDLAAVNVTVLDGNDNAPVFSQPAYAARVREDAAPGARVLQLIADDADSGANGRVAYSIARGDPEGRFALDEDTGYLAVAAPLDRETTPSYRLEVRARDRGVPALETSALLDVEVLDANDNPPTFAAPNYTVVVREDRPLGHVLLEFLVSDADAAPNAAPFTFDFRPGNEVGAFRLENDGLLRTATRFNHRIKDRYSLQVRVFDNGTPPLYSDAWVHVRVIEESQYPPVVAALDVLVNSYLDEFPGGAVGRVHATDRDADDTLTFALAPLDGAPPSPLFEVDPADGTLRAAPALDVGDYRLNVTADDGKYVGAALVRVAVLLLSDEMLAQAVVVRFRAVTDVDFVLRHRKGFVRAVAEACDARPGDVVIVSVQPSGADAEPGGGARRRRQVARDLDVAFAVRVGSGFLPADALRRRLHAHLERLEERAQLVVEELVRGACGGCTHGACVERVEARAPRLVATELVALAAPGHALVARCACAEGWEGARCSEPRGACAECEPRVAHFAGDGYLEYRVERGAVSGARPLDDELAVSLRFRTRRERGTLVAAGGRLDYAALEVAEGYLQFRMELGSGPAAVRAAVPVADGRWHEARLERRGASMRLTVDRRAAQATAPPPAAVLDVRAARRLLVGAALARHAHAFAPEQVTYGFEGCISELKLGGWTLPLETGGTSGDGVAQLARRWRVRVAGSCPALAPPTPCASYPCLNGGTCRDLPDLLEGEAEGYACACHARFRGARCELDTRPCDSQPCLHGGSCSPEAADAGGYRCACPAGLAGERCERGRWCAPGVCAHGGQCEEGEGGPSCRCRGYYGARCQLDVDECAGEPCLNGATCLNEPGSFRCLCPPDKTGMNCGNPLYSDAVMAGGGGAAGGARALRDLWRWAVEARWPLAAATGALLALLALAVLPVWVRRRRRRRAPPPLAVVEKLPARGSKLSNLEAVRRERPTSCAEPPPLNNVDTLRSYGSAGDELEGIPPDYRRNLNIDVADRKPWSEQMHLHTFVDNKIYNDLKGTGRRAGGPGPGGGGGGGGDLVGGYHWDCSDWCGGGGALPGISEVAGSERPDSSSPTSPPTSPPPPRAHTRPARPRRPDTDHTDSAPDTGDPDIDLDLDHDLDLDLDLPPPDASTYLLHPDEYLPRACGAIGATGAAARRRRDLDAASLITMLEERASLLGGDVGGGSGSELSQHLCEIEESDAEEGGGAGGGARHTDV